MFCYNCLYGSWYPVLDYRVTKMNGVIFVVWSSSETNWECYQKISHENGVPEIPSFTAL